MHKDLLLKKYVMYMGLGRRCRGQRLGKVVKITGNTLTVKNAYGEKHRINPKTHEMLGVIVGKKDLEEIQWN